MSKPKTLMIDDVEYTRSDSIQETVIRVDSTGSLAGASTGMKVLVRSYNEGINCGIVEAADETGVILKNARRLWYHKPVDGSSCWYEGVAVHGLSSDSKCSITTSRKFIIERYSMTQCTDDAYRNIMERTPHAQN